MWCLIIAGSCSETITDVEASGSCLVSSITSAEQKTQTCFHNELQCVDVTPTEMYD